MKRRSFIQLAGASGAMSLGLGASMLRLGNVEAAGEDYKALVCIGLGGGNDGFNMIVPFDDIHYQQYAACRTSLALPKSSLSQLSAEFAMHGSMAPLQAAWGDKALAVMHNMGTLAKPLSKAQFNAWWGNNDNTLVPDGLMSHGGAGALWNTGGSDLRWQSSRIATPPAGWGAQAIDQLHARSLVSVGGSPLLGVSATTYPLAVPGNPGGNPGYVTGNYSLQNFADAARYDAYRKLATMNAGADHAFYRAVAMGQQQDIMFNTQMGPILMSTMSDSSANPELVNAFAGTAAYDSYGIVGQMFQIAKMIKARSILGGNRHIFYADMPCFDTHGGQAGPHASFLAGLSHALAGFYAGMKALGLQNNVTAFTMSDFGRTYRANGSDGTDHAWGNEHIVLGGGVDGGKFYGSYPEAVFGGADDFAGDGRFVPTLALDQYAATMLKWFDPSVDVNAVFANLKNFSSPTLPFMKTA
jgi:uncharacterized protein (DUF1501 family)